jgi:hypothetical protein
MFGIQGDALSALERVWPPLPNKIPPSSEKQEKRIVFTLLNELNDLFGIGLDLSPSLERGAFPR